MKKKLLVGFAAGAMMLRMSEVAHANLIIKDMSGYAAGNGYLTYDTNTKLTWLDLTLTWGQSINSVTSGDFIKNDGFRYATVSEVENLFNAMGVLKFEIGQGDYENPNTINALEMIGSNNWQLTHISPESHWMYAMGLISSTGDGQLTYGTIQHYFDTNGNNYNMARISDVSATYMGPDFAGGDGWGSFLVAEPVPEPATMLLMGTGLACLVGARRKRRK